MSLRSRRAFTVVELLVVIAIIGVLMALLLPAVQAARGVARRISCSSNLSQIGKAAMMHDANKGYLPPTRIYPKGLATTPTTYSSDSGNVMSWVHVMFTELGRPDLDTQLKTAIKDDSADVIDLEVLVKLLVCAADTTDTSETARLSYAANGGRENEYNAMNRTAASTPVDWPANGALDDRLKGSSDTFGVKKTTLGDIANGDGATNTIMFSENLDAITWNDARTEFKVSVLWYPTPVIGLNQDAILQGYDPTDINYPDADHARPSSGHSAGFMVCMADGSTKFIADNIDPQVYAALMSSQGKKCATPGVVETMPNPSWQDYVLTEGSF